MPDVDRFDNGFVRVTIQPEEVRNYVKWKSQSVDGSFESFLFPSGKNTWLPYGEYYIIGETITGWTIDTNNIKIELTSTNRLSVLDLKYIKHGNLKVKINDDGAKTTGRWRLVGSETEGTGIINENWLCDSDEIDLYPDSYEIEFLDIDNYTKPDKLIFNIETGKTSVRNGNYVPYGSLKVNITLPTNNSITEISKWRIRDDEDTEWKISGITIDLVPGVHTIEFNNPNNIYTHSDVDVTIESGSTSVEDIIYEGMHILIVPTRSGLYSYNYNNLNSLDVEASISTQINQVKFNNAGTLMVLASNDSPYLLLFDCLTYTQLNDVNIVEPESGCRSVCFSPDDLYLVVSHNNYPYLTIYNTETWEKITLINNLPTSYCNAIEFNATGNLLAVGYNSTPYLSIYNVVNDFSKIDVYSGYPIPSDVLSLKYNGLDLLVGCQTNLIIYKNDTSGTDYIIKSLTSIYGIEVLDYQIILISSLHSTLCQYICQLSNDSNYTLSGSPIFFKSNINTFIKKDPDVDKLVVGALREPTISIYSLSLNASNEYTLALENTKTSLGYCKKFDISPDLSDRSFIKIPTNVSPIDGKRGLQIGAILTTSDFDYYTNTLIEDIHDYTEWKILNSDMSSYNEFIGTITSGPSGASELTTYILPDDEFFQDVKSYSWQVRYHGEIFGWSAWSKLTTFVSSYSYIQTPTNISPADGDENVTATPELISSNFLSINVTDTHIASEWNIYEVENDEYTLVKYSGTINTNLTTYTPPIGVLKGETDDSSPEYAWEVRYEGSLIRWSEWSTLTTFKTDRFVISQPINVSPTNLATNIDPNSITLISTKFSTIGCTDTHSYSYWQIFDASGLLVHNSGVLDITNSGGQIRYSVPKNILTAGLLTYTWQVKYKGVKYDWSEWSIGTSFTTSEVQNATVVVNITPNNFKWRWKSTSSDVYSDYFVSGTIGQQSINPVTNPSINIDFEVHDNYTTPNLMTISLESGSTSTFVVSYIQVSGSLKITTTPANFWKISGYDNNHWKSSGYTETGIPYHTYTIIYDELTGYIKPTDEYVTINAENENIELTSTYTIDPAAIRYTVKVNIILPLSSGGWKLESEEGDTYHSSGDIVTLPPGDPDDILLFKPINGYLTLVPMLINLTTFLTYYDPSVNNQFLFVMYYPSLEDDNPTLTINFNDVNDGTNFPGWKIAGTNETPTSSGVTRILNVGYYNISFTPINGYITPTTLQLVPLMEPEVTGHHDVVKTINYVEGYSDCIKIIITPDDIRNYVKFRARYKVNATDEWGDWSVWIEYYDETKSTFNNVFYNVPIGIYEIQVYEGINNYEIDGKSSKTINYEEEISTVNFTYIESATDNSNYFKIIIAPDAVRIYVKFQARYKVNATDAWGDWSVWVDYYDETNSTFNDIFYNIPNGFYEVKVDDINNYEIVGEYSQTIEHTGEISTINFTYIESTTNSNYVSSSSDSSVTIPTILRSSRVTIPTISPMPPILPGIIRGSTNINLVVKCSTNGGSYVNANGSLLNNLVFDGYEITNDTKIVSNFLNNPLFIFKTCDIDQVDFNKVFTFISSGYYYFFKIKDIDGYSLVNHSSGIYVNASSSIDKTYNLTLMFIKITSEYISFEIPLETDPDPDNVIQPFDVEICSGHSEGFIEYETTYPTKIRFDGTISFNEQNNKYRLISNSYLTTSIFDTTDFAWIKIKALVITGSDYTITITEKVMDTKLNTELITINNRMVKSIGSGILS